MNLQEQEITDVLELEGKRFSTPKHRGDTGEMISVLFESAYFLNIAQRKWIDYLSNLGLYEFARKEIEKMQEYKDIETMQEFVGLAQGRLEIKREKNWFGEEKWKVEDVNKKDEKNIF